MLRRSRRRRKRKKAGNQLTQQVASAVRDEEPEEEPEPEPEEEEPKDDPGKDLKISMGKALVNIGRDKIIIYRKLQRNIDSSLGNIARMIPDMKPQSREAAHLLFRGVSSQIDEAKQPKLSRTHRALLQQEVLKIYAYIKSINELLPQGPVRKNLRIFRDYVLRTFGSLAR